MKSSSFCLRVLAVVVTAVLASAVALAFAETEGSLASARGEALLVRPGVGEVSPAAGISVLPGDTLVTSSDGRVVLLVGTESMFVLGGSAKLSFDAVSSEAAFGRRVSLTAGALRVAAKGTGEAIVVTTPTAIVQIRDAYAIVRHDPVTASTSVLGLAGQTDVTDREKTLAVYSVEKGQFSTVETGRPPRIPAAIDEDAATRWLQETALPSDDARRTTGRSLIAGDDPLRDWPLASRASFATSGLGSEGGSAAEFEALPLPGPSGFDEPGGVEIDRESEVTVILIFNNVAEKKLDKKGGRR